MTEWKTIESAPKLLPVGTRVQLSDAALRDRSGDRQSFVGTLVGYSKSGTDARVRWDHRVNVQYYHPTHIAPIADGPKDSGE